MDVTFFWSGEGFHYANVLAVASAALMSPSATVRLITDQPLTSSEFRVLEEIANVVIDDLRPNDLLRRELLDVYERTRFVQHRSDIVRFSALADNGGVYLDTDTLTLTDLTTLPDQALFYDGKVVHCGVMKMPAGAPVLTRMLQRLAGISDADLSVYQSIIYIWTDEVLRLPPPNGFCDLELAFPVHWKDWEDLFAASGPDPVAKPWVLHHYGYFSSNFTRTSNLRWLERNDSVFARAALPTARALAALGYEGPS